MSREFWATYSVKDHLETRSLAVDLMLFDRLVFPVPQKANIPPETNRLAPNGVVRWDRNPVEWARWDSEKWDPEAQAKLLELLKPVVRKVEWESTGKIEDQYRREAERLAAQGLPDYAFQATRTVLTQDLPSYVEGVTALGPAYRGFDQRVQDHTFLEQPDASVPASRLINVLASKFFVPDSNHDANSKLPDVEFLKTTLDFVTGDSGFRTRRRAFMTWQQDFIRNGATDPESIRRAAQEMQDLLEDANRTAKKLTVRKAARYVFRIAPSALGVAGALAGGGPIFAIGGVFISLGAIAIDEKFFKASENAQFPQTAFVHDARTHFGWKPKGD
jgi:hypothetical protein